MGKVVKSVFGGRDDSSQDAQIEQNTLAKDFIEQKGTEARQDLLNLFPAADTNRNLGTQAALDVLGQSAPQAIESFQLGNVGAQAAILGGTPQINMIGRQGGRATLDEFNNLVDTNRLPMTGVDTGFTQQQLPNFINTREVSPDPRTATQNMVGGFGSDAELLLAAARGQIPGVPRSDREFLSKLLAGNPGFSQSTEFVNSPAASLGGIMGVEGGLNPKNEQILGNLLTRIR